MKELYIEVLGNNIVKKGRGVHEKCNYGHIRENK